MSDRAKAIRGMVKEQFLRVTSENLLEESAGLQGMERFKGSYLFAHDFLVQEIRLRTDLLKVLAIVELADAIRSTRGDEDEGSA